MRYDFKMPKKVFLKRLTPIKKINYYPSLWDTSVMDIVTIIELSSLGLLSHPLQPKTWHAKITEQIKPFFSHNPAKKYSDEWFYNHERAIVDSYRHIKEYLYLSYVRPKKVFFEERCNDIKMFFVTRYINFVDWFIDFLFYIEFHFILGSWLSKDLLLLSILNSLPTSFIIKFNKFTDPFDYTVGPTWIRCPKEEVSFSNSIYLSLYSSSNDDDMDTFLYIPNYLSSGKSFYVDPTMNNIKSAVPLLHSYSTDTGTITYKSNFHLIITHLMLILFSALFGFSVFFLLKFLYFPYLDITTNGLIANLLKSAKNIFDPIFDSCLYTTIFGESQTTDITHKLNLELLEKHYFYNNSDNVITLDGQKIFEELFFKGNVYKPRFSIFPESAFIDLCSSEYSLFHNFISFDYESSCDITKDFLPPVINLLCNNSIENLNMFLRGEWNSILQNGFLLDKFVVFYFYADSFVEAENFVKSMVFSFNWYLDLFPNTIVLEGIDSKKLCQMSNNIFKPIFLDNLDHKICFGVRIGGFC